MNDLPTKRDKLEAYKYDLTIKQTARVLECSPDRILKLIKQGKLAAYKDDDPKAGNPNYSGNMRWLVLRESVEKRIQDLETAERARL